MGSYLSIVNDTPDTWYCQVGDDMAAASIFTYVTIGLGAVAAIVATAGAAAPLLTFASVNGVTVVLGISTSTALAIATAAASSAAAVGGVASAASIVDLIVSQTVANIKMSGYDEILPNASHRYGKFTLSWWRQGHCRRLTKNLEPDNLGWVEEEVYLRPIFSGASDNSNLDHSLTFWIKKFGLENRQEFKIPPPDNMPSWGDVNKKLEFMIETPPTNSPVGGTTAPSSLPVGGTTAPSSSLPLTMVCNVCGDGFEVTVPEATVSIPGNGNFSCGVLDTLGKTGNITIEGCPFVTQFLAPCGCPVPTIPPDSAPWIPGNTSSECVCPSNPPSLAPMVSPTIQPTTTRDEGGGKPAPVPMPTSDPLSVSFPTPHPLLVPPPVPLHVHIPVPVKPVPVPLPVHMVDKSGKGHDEEDGRGKEGMMGKGGNGGSKGGMMDKGRKGHDGDYDYGGSKGGMMGKNEKGHGGGGKGGMMGKSSKGGMSKSKVKSLRY